MGKKTESKYPRDLKYSETHEWVRVDGPEAIIGISDYAIKRLGDLVSIELPKVGETVEMEAAIGEIESVKTVAELIMPVTGKVAAVNSNVLDNIDLLSDSPYDEGWLVRIKMKDPKEIGHLMAAKAYAEYVESLAEEGADEEEEDEDEEDEEDDDEEPGA
jgi:glycine cleavage system H protein